MPTKHVATLIVLLALVTGPVPSFAVPFSGPAVTAAVPDDWSDYPAQRLHCPNKKCRERLRFLQTVFPGATSFPRSCRIGLSITATDQRYIAENLFLRCPRAGLVIEDGENQHDD